MTQALFDTADLFECIALSEAASFQDLAFTSAIAHMLGDLMLGSPRRRWGCPGKSVFLLTSASVSALSDAMPSDIVCIRQPAGSPDLVRDVWLEARGRTLRTCVLLRGPRGLGEASAQFLGARIWVQWDTPREIAPGSTSSSLLFSCGWQEDVSAHTARVLQRYMATLPHDGPMADTVVACTIDRRTVSVLPAFQSPAS
jgi:hypothetical protein